MKTIVVIGIVIAVIVFTSHGGRPSKLNPDNNDSDYAGLVNEDDD